MTDAITPNAFAPIIDRFTASQRHAFGIFIERCSDRLDAQERELIQGNVDHALRANAQLKLNRVLLLELHAAKRAGELTAADDASRFAQFLERASSPAFDQHFDRRYPPLRQRLQHLLDRQRVALEAMLQRLLDDRAALAPLLGGPSGRLLEISLGLGDLHAGGQSVARLKFERGQLMYKPRSLRVDAALDSFLAKLFDHADARIRVPAVIDRGDYGWAGFVTHHYCEGDDELRAFYRGLGHWLAVLRLLGGTDIHQENLIAAGPIPVVIDVESLFVPNPNWKASPFGHAYDLALTLVRGSVLRTGIVPFRSQALGLDNVDISAAGGLPDQQPTVHLPVIVEDGTPQARMRIVDVEMAPSQNHPDPRPQVSAYWDCISEGFFEGTRRLQRLDASGELAPLLGGFVGCHVRQIRRSTTTYVEIGRMLWHPASLHDEAKAIERARSLLARGGALDPIAPSDPQEIAGEIEAMRYGDVPIFGRRLGAADVDSVLTDWRSMRVELEELTIRGALVATDLNRHMDDRIESEERRFAARRPHADQLEQRRRRLAAEMVERMLQAAVRGDDGSVTWISPEITKDGWMIRPLQPGMYFGLGGVLIALAGYRHEVERGRADAVAGIEEAFDGARRVLEAMEATQKPTTVGGFSGYGAQIWTWLTLADLMRCPRALAQAVARAEALRATGLDVGEAQFDLIDGYAGLIVPLLGLAEASGDRAWIELAAQAGRRLEAGAIVDDRGCRWPTRADNAPVGGFAHGTTGIAWALTRLILAGAGEEADRVRWRKLAEGAFALEESRYDEKLGNWLDAREQDGGDAFNIWCYGSVGLGLAATDLYARTGDVRHRRTLRRAVGAAGDKWGITHTLCHGDLSLWELLVRAASVDGEGCAIERDTPIAQVVSSIEEHNGMVGGLTRAAFTPGLMTGLAGAIHSLNRMHPDCDLPSPLLLERMNRAA